MLEVVSFSSFSDHLEPATHSETGPELSVHRGGFVNGTRIGTARGWKRVEHLQQGDLVRTADNGFQVLQRVSRDLIHVPAQETRSGFLPVLIPPKSAYNDQPLWLMPEQGIVLSAGWLDRADAGRSIVSARFLSGLFTFEPQAPASRFEVTSLFFDDDQVVFIEGGLLAYCAAARFRTLSNTCKQDFRVLEEADAAALVAAIDRSGDLSAVARPMGAVPAIIPSEPIFPIRPQRGVRRPGRPGRPDVPALYLRTEWQA